MKIGLQLPNFTWPGGPAQIPGKLADIARVVEDAGFASLWVMDHFFQISMIGPPEHEMLESYSTLGYLAALTKRVKLGPLVTGVIGFSDTTAKGEIALNATVPFCRTSARSLTEKSASDLVGLARIELATSALSVRLKATIWQTSDGAQGSDLRRWANGKMPDGS